MSTSKSEKSAHTAYYAGVSALGERPVTHDAGIITIIESPDKPEQIGVAANAAVPGQTRVLYVLHVYDEHVPGYWLLEDGQFKQAEVDMNATANRR